MSDYRRLISYIYSYENGVKTKNSGFAKVEARDSDCKISISLKITEALKDEAEDNTLEVFMFTRKDGRVYKTNIGRIRIVNGNSLFRAQYDEQKIGSKQFQLSDIAGIFICDKSFLDRTGNDNIVYASEWDDTTVLVDEFLDESEVAVDVTEQRNEEADESEQRNDEASEQKNGNIESAAGLGESDIGNSGNGNTGYENNRYENLQPQSQNSDSVVENQQLQTPENKSENEQLQKQNNEIEKRQSQSQNSEIEKRQSRSQNSEIEKRQSQSQNNEIEKRQPQSQNNIAESSSMQNWGNKAEKEQLQHEKNEADNHSLQGQINILGSNGLQNNGMENHELHGNEVTDSRLPNIGLQNNKSIHQSVGSDRKSNMSMVELRVQNSNFPSQGKTETKEDIKKYQEQLQNLIMSPAHNSQTGDISADTTIRNNQRSSGTVLGNNTGNADTVQKNNAENTAAVRENNAENIAAPRGNNAENIAVPRGNNAGNIAAPRGNNAGNIAAPRGNNAGNIAAPRENSTGTTQRYNYSRQDYFTMLCNCYPNLKIEGLSDRCLKITPHDISYLPRRYWHLGNNSFLLHGFYHYRYILLCEETSNINESDNADRNGSLRNGNQWSSNQTNSNDKKDSRYMICVPGIYQKREQTIARTYGFSVFKEMPQENVKNFGYWCFYL